MKLNKFIFKHFAPIPSKQWKQKIQYELKGANYQSELVYTNSDGISTLPFYTQSDNESIVKEENNVQSQKAIVINVGNDVVLNNVEALTAINAGIDIIYFSIYDKSIDTKILLDNISIPIVVNCHFLNTSFLENLKSSYKGKSLKIITDPISKLLTTGNWYRNAVWDFEQLQKIINYNDGNLSVNVSLFNNAGATQVQQLAYAINQVLSYNKHLSLTNCKTITYHTSVSTNVFIEIAKLKTLRILHNSLNEYLNTQFNCEIIVVKNKRNINVIDSYLNNAFTETEQLIAYAGYANIVCLNFNEVTFFKEDLSKVESSLNNFITNDYDNKSFDSVIYIEKLIQQLLTKTTLLINTVEEGGGFIVQYKKGIITKKIEQKALEEQKAFNSTFKQINTASVLKNKIPLNYPFFKFENKQTQYKPIIEKRLTAPFEKTIWDSTFKHD